MSLETFRIAFPTTFIEDNTSPGAVSGSEPAIPHVYVIRDVHPDHSAAVRMKAADSGWGFVGAGDQRPSALAAWTPPTTSSAYTGGLLDLLQAARLSDLNDLRVKLGQAIARIDVLTDMLSARGITEGT